MSQPQKRALGSCSAESVPYSVFAPVILSNGVGPECSTTGAIDTPSLPLVDTWTSPDDNLSCMHDTVCQLCCEHFGLAFTITPYRRQTASFRPKAPGFALDCPVPRKDPHD